MEKSIFERLKSILHTVFVLLTLYAFQAKADQLMRFPDIHDNQIIFVSGEDIWTVSASGGEAVRLTLHDGSERFPKFSPDGSLIAFTGQYDGNADVYVMNNKGGDIRRVTYHPGVDEVVGWHPLKNKIIFSSGRHSTTRYTKLFLISPDGTGLEELIMYDASRGSFSPDGNKIAYNKVSRENRTWKRYTGGLAQEIYVYDLKENTEENITGFRGTDRMPMWIGNKIWFTSDRDRRLNLYYYDTNTQQITQVTRHTEFDVRRPSEGSGKIVYELGGDIWLLETETGKTVKADIRIHPDAPETRPYLADVSDRIQGFDISPSGKRTLIVARGEVFSVPAKEGVTFNLSKSCGSREKDAAWSPDGRQIAWISDKSGEYEIYLHSVDGNKETIKLTEHRDGYRHTLRWSPDSKKIAFADQHLRCYILDVESKKISTVDQAEYEHVDISLNKKPIYDYSWSPDSRYLAYSKMNSDLVYQVYLYSLETKTIHPVSNGLFYDFNPVFTKDGEHLLFVSNRSYNPVFCDMEWEMVYKNVAVVVSITLKKEGPSILPLKNDSETENTPATQRENSFRIDFEGLASRCEVLPLDPGNYRNLAVNSTHLFFLNKTDGDFNTMDYRAVGPQNLFAYDFESKKTKQLVEGIDDFKIAADGSDIVYIKQGKPGIIPAGETGNSGNVLNLSGLKLTIDPVLEWKAVFNEAWRMERDFYYEPGMHGVDWNAMKTKYGNLLERATCRQDVEYLIGELIGELNTSHTYVYGGINTRTAEAVNIGMLGADWETDHTNNLYRFKKIYRENDWSRKIYAPLAKPGVNVREGDYLLAVNGQKVTGDRSIYSYFVDQAGKQVVLQVNEKPTMEGAREVMVVPLSSETALRYTDWLENNRKAVEKASDGQIGYIYFPDTYEASATDFPKYFYSQTKKKGLIIDGRFNGGGLDPEIFLQRLLKKPHGYWTRRYSADQPIPLLSVNAHMVCLTNRYAGSGGDMLPYEFRWNKMGPVIGTRTWGGLVGVSMFLELMDGSGLTAPDYRIYNEQGKWVVENEGVEPDIVIEQNSLELSKGIDTQLMKGVEILLQQIRDNPVKMPEHQPFPVDKP